MSDASSKCAPSCARAPLDSARPQLPLGPREHDRPTLGAQTAALGERLTSSRAVARAKRFAGVERARLATFASALLGLARQALARRAWRRPWQARKCVTHFNEPFSPSAHPPARPPKPLVVLRPLAAFACASISRLSSGRKLRRHHCRHQCSRVGGRWRRRHRCLCHLSSANYRSILDTKLPLNQ